ncbi:MAG TPA: hypothetical protein VL357_01805 [Rariglobus sp.]|jgi:hypothetical protein|nr:hypothetical protein [Rariglobus sp.]
MTPEQEIRQNAIDLIKAHGPEIYWSEHDAMRGINAASQVQLKAVVSRILNLLADRKRPSMSLDCLRIAAGFSSQSYQSVGDCYGVSKEAISLRVHAFTDALGLPPAGRMYSPKERAVYQKNGRIVKTR